MERHIPPAGQSMIPLHKAMASCPCGPTRTVITKRAASGRGGSHQGYKSISVTYQHKMI